MTRLEVLRKIVTAERDHVHLGKIGRVQKYATPDGREKQIYVFRALRSVLRRTA